MRGAIRRRQMDTDLEVGNTIPAAPQENAAPEQISLCQQETDI